MPQLVKVKVRKVGTSLGILIAGETIRKGDIEEGDGIAKDFPVMFARDKKTRYL